MRNGGRIDASTYSAGNAGRIQVIAGASISVDDSGRIESRTGAAGSGGDAALSAPRIDVKGRISAESAPSIDSILKLFSNLVEGLYRAPPTDASDVSGNAGSIALSAGQELVVRTGGQVVASTLGSGNGGQIDLQAGESILVEDAGSSIASETGADGDGGNVTLHAPRIEVASGGGISARSQDPSVDAGDAGSVALGTDELWLDGGTIATSAGPAAGGAIEIHAERVLDLDHGSEITASTGSGTGGEITIDPQLMLLKHGSTITAGADEGHGGKIRIAADLFFGFPGTLVSAVSHNQQLSGTVEIHSPDVNLAGTLATLPSNFLDAASLMRERCAARRSGERVGSFSVRGPGGIPAEPDGWLPAPLLPAASTTTAVTPDSSLLVARLSGPLLLHPGCL